MAQLITDLPGLMTPSVGYKPFRYPWAYDFWKKQQQVHWMPEEVPLGEDLKDWAANLNDKERNLLTQIFRFFTQSDVEVADNYMERYGRIFKPTEVKMMLASFANMETIHIAAYALLLETIGMPESEFGAFMEYEALKAKHDYMQQFGVDSNADIARTLAMFGGFTEGLQLFASFAMLMNFPRFNKMKGMGQIVSWSVRDESLHCEGIVKLYHAFNAETQCVTKSVADDIVDCCKTVVGLEDKLHRPGLRGRRGAGHDARGHQGLHPLHRRLAPAPAQAAGSLWGEGKPAALAAEPAQRRRTRQLLRGPLDGILQGRHQGPMAWGGRRLGPVRQPDGQAEREPAAGGVGCSISVTVHLLRLTPETLRRPFRNKCTVTEIACQLVTLRYPSPARREKGRVGL